MTSLSVWYDRCAFLWKSRQNKDPGEMAAKMDAKLGPSSYGDRKIAGGHYARIGPRKALAFGSHPEGSPERLAYEFAKDVARFSRSNQVSVADSMHKDSLSTPIDSAHLKHYGSQWADHFDMLEHVPRGVETDEGVRRMPGMRTPSQLRSTKVSARLKHMASQGHKDPFATMDDLQTIHTGVERAIQTGKVSTADANRYRVMRHAVGIAQNKHKETYPGLAFKPSYAAMDTTALRVMHEGVQHLHESGFLDAKNRLQGVLGSAIESHAVHPYIESTRKAQNNRSVALPYPGLHVMGSVQHKTQQAHLETFNERVERSRESKESKQSKIEVGAVPVQKPKEVAPAAESAPEMTYEEMRERQDRGEKVDPKIVNRLEMEKRQAKKDLTRSLISDWKLWRREAA